MLQLIPVETVEEIRDVLQDIEKQQGQSQVKGLILAVAQPAPRPVGTRGGMIVSFQCPKCQKQFQIS